MSKALSAVVLLAISNLAFGQVTSLTPNGTNTVGVIAWPGSGTWYMRAILLDDMGDPVGTITEQISFVLGADDYPNIIIDMAADATSGQIRFYRSQTPFSGGDMSIDSSFLGCPSGSICEMGPTSTALTNGLNGGWSGATVLPVELQSFGVD